MFRARAASDVGWAATEESAPHSPNAAFENPAHRPASVPRVPTAASRSFAVPRKSITSRARTVSTAGTATAMERDRVEIALVAARLEADFVQTCNLKRPGVLDRAFRNRFASMRCFVNVNANQINK